MRAVICEEPGRLALIERPRPEPKPGEVSVRIRRVGVCGTDFHIFGGKHPFLEYPRVMGHELSGTVETAPEGSALSPGQNVYIVPYLSCGDCSACRKGITNASGSARPAGCPPAAASRQPTGCWWSGRVPSACRPSSSPRRAAPMSR